MKPTNEDDLGWFKAKLVDIENQYRITSTKQNSLFTDEHIEGLKQLKANRSILVLRPDKGSGIVVMDKSDYKDKMLRILRDETRFRPDNTPDDPSELEKKICAELKTLTQANLIQEFIQPWCSFWPGANRAADCIL
ncbi:unnamed protein product [Echinostoma caproni]|uniref:Antitoxin n=1 Tax=Echinostoma caproni TaxID=27848 RepID=A0A183B706_9TREM|nr:unnamed protein product [Echinostoma caproni]